MILYDFLNGFLKVLPYDLGISGVSRHTLFIFYLFLFKKINMLHHKNSNITMHNKLGLRKKHFLIFKIKIVTLKLYWKKNYA